MSLYIAISPLYIVICTMLTVFYVLDVRVDELNGLLLVLTP